MRAITQDTYGSSETWHLTDIESPEIDDHEVLVRVHAAGLDRGTWHSMTGRPYLMRIMGFGFRTPKNHVPGLAVAGTVEAVGATVTRFAVGDEVFGVSRGAIRRVRRSPRGQARPQAVEPYVRTGRGGSRSRPRRPSRACAPAASRPGRRSSIIGASGGVGTYAVQLAKAFGAEVTGVCSTAKIDLVRSLGADHVIDYTQEDFTDGSRRYDFILDIGGNTPLSHLRRALTTTGTLVIVGGENKGNWTGGFGRSLRAPVMSLVRAPAAHHARRPRSSTRTSRR